MKTTSMTIGNDDDDSNGAMGDKVEDDSGGTMGDNDGDEDDGNVTGNGTTGYDDDDCGWHYWGNGDGER